MSRKFVFALIIIAMTAMCIPAWAQGDSPARTFKLLRDTATAASKLELEEEEGSRWEPGIAPGSIEVSFFLGFLDLKKTIFSHDQIIYKYSDEATYWGDVSIAGQTSFNPGIRIGYNLSKWLCLEGISTISFAEYSSTVTNRKRRPNETGAPVDFYEPAVGEFDLESRSLITGSVGANALVYPLNISGDGKGRLQPFLTTGLSAMWYDINSNFTSGATSAIDLNFGGGIRLLADRNISIRLELLLHHNSMEFTPADFFKELNEGTTQVPLNEYPTDNLAGQPVTSFGSNSLTTLSYSLGVQGSF